jgi:hypothetical protein
MEYFDGLTMNCVMFEKFELKAKQKIWRKIAEQLRLLQSIPPPNPSYYGRINYQPWMPYAMLVGCVGDDMIGPFDTYEEFLQQIWVYFELRGMQRLALRSTQGGCKIEEDPVMQIMAASFERFFDKSSVAAEPKLTHMDLKLENMLLVPSHSDPSTELEDWDVVIIDWQDFGWMPAWAQPTGMWFRLNADGTDSDLALWNVLGFWYPETRLWLDYAKVFGGML